MEGARPADQTEHYCDDDRISCRDIAQRKSAQLRTREGRQRSEDLATGEAKGSLRG